MWHGGIISFITWNYGVQAEFTIQLTILITLLSWKCIRVTWYIILNWGFTFSCAIHNSHCSYETNISRVVKSTALAFYPVATSFLIKFTRDFTFLATFSTRFIKKAFDLVLYLSIMKWSCNLIGHNEIVIPTVLIDCLLFRWNAHTSVLLVWVSIFRNYVLRLLCRDTTRSHTAKELDW